MGEKYVFYNKIILILSHILIYYIIVVITICLYVYRSVWVFLYRRDIDTKPYPYDDKFYA